MRKYSPLQKDVLSLLRKFLKINSKLESPESRINYKQQIMARFKQDAKLKRSNFDAIEYKLRIGKNQLQFFEQTSISNIRIV